MDPILIAVVAAAAILAAGGAMIVVRRRTRRAPEPPRFTPASADRTVVGMADVGPPQRDDRTVVGSGPGAFPSDRTVVGPAPADPPSDRTVVGAQPPAQEAVRPTHETARTVIVRRGPRARLTVAKGGSGGPFELAEREYSIGRSSSSDIVLADPSVSGRHATLTPRAGDFLLTDLGSTNGTSVNGQPLTSPQILRGGELIGIGDAVLRYERLA